MTESPDNFSRNMKKGMVVATHHATEKKPNFLNKDSTMLDKEMQ